MSTAFSRRGFLGASSASVLSGMLSAAMPAKSSIAEATSAPEPEPTKGSRLAKRPNLILFMPDEMRADSLACYGNSITKTPNLDKLAKSGTRFSNCHVQFPVCGASRCSLLTGWPTSVRGHRSLYYFLRPEEPNMFRYLKEAGYDVFFFGSHNDALASESFPSSVTQWGPGSIPMKGLVPPGSTAFGLTPGAYSFLYPPFGDRRGTYDYGLVQSAIEVLKRHDSDKPFCVFLPMLQPHAPYTVCEDFYNMYSPRDIPALIPANLPKKPLFHKGIIDMYGLNKLSEADYRKLRAVYYGQVSYVDWLLGELMEAMESTRHDKDTTLMVLSDHGDYAGDYGLVEKWPSGLEDCLTHVPLIVSTPGGKRNVVSEETVELFDVMPTCLDLAGTKARHTHFARTLVPQLNGNHGDPHRAAFAEGGYNTYEPQCFEPAGAGGGPYTGKIRLQNEQPVSVSRSAMVRTKDYKLILRPQDQSELYCYKDDPNEQHNLYGDSKVAGVQTELELKLAKRFINTTGIAPRDKDPRDTPPFYPTRTDIPPGGWQQSILDS